MKRIRAIAATTGPTVDGHRLTVESLNELASQLSSFYIPQHEEHHIEKPPVGRVSNAKVVPSKGGEYALEVEVEIWDSNDSIEDLRGDGRGFAQQPVSGDRFSIEIDRSLDTPVGKELIAELRKLGCGAISFSEKRAIDADLALIIGLVLGPLVNEAYNSIKNCLMKHFRERTDSQNGTIIFRYHYQHLEREIEIVLHVRSGQMENLPNNFPGSDPKVQSLLFQLAEKFPDAARIVLTAEPQGPILNFLVLKDCIPINGQGDVIVTTREIKLGGKMSIGISRPWDEE